MANFNTHLAVGATVSGIAATASLGANLAQPGEALVLFSLGTLGGVLPDLDSDNSVLLQIIFNILSVFFAFMVMFKYSAIYSLAELAIIWLICYLAVQYGVFSIFRNFTRHRGIFHSIPAGVFAWLIVTFICYKFLNFPELRSWITGFFVFLGYITHLALDEIYSVDLSNKKIKRSLGTAMKLVDLSNIPGSIAIYLAILGMLLLAPGPRQFVDTVFTQNTYNTLKRNAVPKNGKWFFMP